MNLGDAAEISLAVDDIDTAAPFFEMLGFSPARTLELPYRTTAFTDGHVTIALHEASFSSPTLTYYGTRLSEVIPVLHEQGRIVQEIQRSAGQPTVVAFRAPGGLRVVLSSHHPPGGTSIGSGSHCGSFSEFALPVPDMSEATQFWTAHGLDPTADQHEPYPWATVTNGVTRLGLHETQDFDRPACLFVSEDTAALLEDLQKSDAGISRQRDQHAVVEGPGNLLLFLFQDPA